MKLNRRQVLVMGAGATAAVATGLPTISFAADDPTAQDVINKFTGGADMASGRIDLGTPEIAENGNTVPIQVAVESPMTADDHVAEVMIVADGNPRPDVATFKFSEMSGEAQASIRIRLAKTQNVIAVAKMSNGSFYMVSNPVKVTIGGCGG